MNKCKHCGKKIIENWSDPAVHYSGGSHVCLHCEILSKKKIGDVVQTSDGLYRELTVNSMVEAELFKSWLKEKLNECDDKFKTLSRLDEDFYNWSAMRWAYSFVLEQYEAGTREEAPLIPSVKGV